MIPFFKIADIKSGRAVPFSRRRLAFSTVRLKEFLNFRQNDSGVNASWSMVKSGKWRIALNVVFALMLLKIIPIHGCSWLSRRQSKVSANIKSPVISNVVKLSQVLISTSWPLWAKSRSREMKRSIKCIILDSCSLSARSENPWDMRRLCLLWVSLSRKPPIASLVDIKVDP